MTIKDIEKATGVKGPKIRRVLRKMGMKTVNGKWELTEAEFNGICSTLLPELSHRECLLLSRKHNGVQAAIDSIQEIIDEAGDDHEAAYDNALNTAKMNGLNLNALVKEGSIKF